MKFQSEKEVKAAVSGIRRELKAIGVTSVSHTQMLEVFARGVGFTSYGELLATAVPFVEPASVPRAPVVAETYAGEAQFLDELRHYAPYRLRNDAGQFDLKASCAGYTDTDLIAVDGLYLEHTLQGTAEFVPAVYPTGVSGRSDAGDVQLSSEPGTSTDMDWDAQFTRKDSRGQRLWIDTNGKPFPEDRLVLLPQCCEELNMVSERVLVDCEIELLNRMELVDAARRWLVDHSLVSQALAEMPVDDSDRFEDGFYAAAEKFYPPGRKLATTLGSMQWVIGFALHAYEFKELRKSLVALNAG